MSFRGSAVLFLVLIGVFCGSLGTMLWLGPEHFSERGVQMPVTEGVGLGSNSIEKIDKTMQLLEEHYVKAGEVNRQKLLTGALNGMVEAVGDPYTIYMDNEQTDSFHNSVIDSSFEGIGAEVDSNDGQVKVISPIKGSPAEKAGVLANDIILSVNGKSLKGLSIVEAIKKIRGPAGTQAKLLIEREGLSKPIQIIVVRDEIPIETVYAELLDNKVGKIEISQFSMNTADHFIKELKTLENQGIEGLIIDVRNNPGGLLESVIEIMEQFVPKGETLIQIKNRDSEPELIESNGTGKPYPIVVLINEGSASASEILAAALSETIGAELVGTTTFGKGSVQNTFEEELADGSNLKITVAEWLSPNGKQINKKGVKPTVKVKQSEIYDVARLEIEKSLQFDSVSEEVVVAQRALKVIGTHNGRIDGYFDRETETSVKTFQASRKLKPSGIIDQKTKEKINEELRSVFRDDKNDRQLNQAIKTINEIMK